MDRDEAEKLMRELHAGQLDKVGRPYEEHPLAVARILGPESPEEEQITALLHDVPEDTSCSVAELKSKGCPQASLAAIQLLTRPPDLTYAEYINRIKASNNIMAIRVKIADLCHHLARIDQLPETERGLGKRYNDAFTTLLEALRLHRETDNGRQSEI